MKRIEKILGLSIISFAIIFGAFYIFLVIAGKQIIAKQIENLIHKKTTVEFFGFNPGFHLEIKKLNIEGIFKADSIYITPNLFGFFTGKLSFNNLKLIRPELTYIRTPPVVVEGIKPNGEIIASLPAKPIQPEVSPSSTKPLPFAFRRIKIKDGQINFIDQSMSNKSIKIIIKEINCSVSNLYLYPQRTMTSFDLTGKIPWGDSEVQGQIEFNGWINHFKKDMQASLKIKDIDAVYLYPYYSTWVDLDKARIEKAKLNFSSDIKGLNNNITAACHMELTNMVRKPLEAGESEEKASVITNKVLDMFKTADQGRVELNFIIPTKMDSPQFGFENFKTAFEGKIMQSRQASAFKPADVLTFPVKLIESGAKTFSDLGKALVDGIFAIGNDLGNSIREKAVVK
ncbi:MAG: DUF748 domain-containing protein [Candidatus Omnitrophica bacterium]|nr:DUF748 domain-containing protein [Candidatus Omnitrophota bacterium]